MDLFNSVNDITNTGFGSYVNPYDDPNNDMIQKLTQDQTAVAPATQTPAKPQATGAEIAAKAGDMFKQFGQAVGNKHVNIAAPPQMTAPNLANLAAMSAPQQMPMMPQIGMPQMQVPQMPAMGQPMPALPMAMSDYRTKTKIQDASIKIDALLNKVYENLTNRK